MTPAIFSMIAGAAAFTAISNLALRFGIHKIGGFELSTGRMFPQIAAFCLEPACLIGLLGQFAAAILWFRVISVVDISRGYPMLVSLTFLLVVLGSLVFFGEPVSWRKIAGLIVIVGGIQLVSRG